MKETFGLVTVYQNSLPNFPIGVSSQTLDPKRRDDIPLRKRHAIFPHDCIIKSPEPSLESSETAYQAAGVLRKGGYQIWG